VLLLAFGVREPYALIAFMLAAFVTATIVSEFWRGARVIRSQTGRTWGQALAQLVLRNTRRYGGYIVHFGIVVVFVGIAGAAFNKEREMEMPMGATLELGRYAVTLKDRAQGETPNYIYDRLTLEVRRGDEVLTTLMPERRLYKASEQPLTKVTIHSGWREDLYIYFAGVTETGVPIIHAYLNPLVRWLWIGGGIVILGTLIALYPGRRPMKVAVSERAAAREREVAYAKGD
jgi:cytochrome c-type biogenesis protein CcmF